MTILNVENEAKGLLIYGSINTITNFKFYENYLLNYGFS